MNAINRNMPTKEQLQAAVRILHAVAETVREASRVPSGTVYAALCGRVDLQGYQGLIRTLVNAGLIEVRSHELVWVGPRIAPERGIAANTIGANWGDIR